MSSLSHLIWYFVWWGYLYLITNCNRRDTCFIQQPHGVCICQWYDWGHWHSSIQIAPCNPEKKEIMCGYYAMITYMEVFSCNLLGKSHICHKMQWEGYLFTCTNCSKASPSVLNNEWPLIKIHNVKEIYEQTPNLLLYSKFSSYHW